LEDGDTAIVKPSFFCVYGNKERRKKEKITFFFLSLYKSARYILKKKERKRNFLSFRKDKSD